MQALIRDMRCQHGSQFENSYHITQKLKNHEAHINTNTMA